MQAKTHEDEYAALGWVPGPGSQARVEADFVKFFVNTSGDGIVGEDSFLRYKNYLNKSEN